MVNQEIEHHFCTFVNHQQHNLFKKLAIARFVAYNKVSALTKVSLFLVIKSFYFYMSFDIVERFDASIYERIFLPKSIDTFTNMQITWDFHKKP